MCSYTAVLRRSAVPLCCGGKYRLGTLPNPPHPCLTPLPTAQTDLADEQQLREIEGEIRGVNAEASITRCHRCSIDLRLILNTGMYSAGLRGAAAAAGDGGENGGAAAADGGSEQQQGQQQAQQAGEEHACGPQCSDPEHHHHHHHGSDSDPNKVGTLTITLPAGQPLDLARLRHWLDTLLWEDGAAGAAGTAEAADIFRIKGLLCVAGSTHKHVLQVGGRVGQLGSVATVW